MSLVAAQAMLVIVAVTVIFIPETRTLPMRATTYALFIVTGVALVLRLWRSGWLSMSLPELYRARPHITLLELAASALGGAALSAMR